MLPAFLRIDKDVKVARHKLHDLHDKYMDFNINDLKGDITNRLNRTIAEVSTEFQAHKDSAIARLVEGERVNNNSINLKTHTQEMRIESNTNITSALAESKVSLQTIDGQNKQMTTLRDQLEIMNSQLRQMQNNIRSEKIVSENLRNVDQVEKDLRKARDQRENQILNVASEAQDNSIEWTNQNLQKIQSEDQRILKVNEDMVNSMEARMNSNVQTLLNIIEDDMRSNQVEMTQKIPVFVEDYQQKYSQLTSANTKLQQQLKEIKKIQDAN